MDSGGGTLGFGGTFGFGDPELLRYAEYGPGVNETYDMTCVRNDSVSLVFEGIPQCTKVTQAWSARCSGVPNISDQRIAPTVRDCIDTFHGHVCQQRCKPGFTACYYFLLLFDIFFILFITFYNFFTKHLKKHLDVLFRTVSRGSPGPPGSVLRRFREGWRRLEKVREGWRRLEKVREGQRRLEKV